MPPAPQQSSGGENSMTPLWVIAAIGVVIFLTWYFFHAQIVMATFKFKLWEINLLSLFTNSLQPLATQIKQMGPANFDAVGYQEFFNVCNEVGLVVRYPVVALLGIFAVVLFLSHASMRYRKLYSMNRLVEEERENWPQITPIASLDLVSLHVDEGPWAMAMTPMQFAKKHQLLQEERAVGTTLKRSGVDVSVRRNEAYRIFSLQLGPYWTRVEDLNIHTRALFAVFAARANRDRDGASKLLMQIAASTHSGQLDFSGTDELLNKHKNFKPVLKVVQRHAFVLTVMAAMLKLGRGDGVVASADFLWVKPVDRTLWFMLNCVGRQTPCAEVSGPFAHWLAEVKFGRRLLVPMIDEAVNALEQGIKEIIYKPDEEE
jgi:intracellular multiplication protein IcmP